jgi:hypothetical protein
VLRIGALLTFCGGPLYFADVLKPQLADPWGLLVAFAPVAVLAFVTLTLLEEPSDRSVPLLWVGALAAATILVMSVAAAAAILGGESRADAGLILFGCVVSTATAGVYVSLIPRTKPADV